jgi:hypothetical protein
MRSERVLQRDLCNLRNDLCVCVRSTCFRRFQVISILDGVYECWASVGLWIKKSQYWMVCMSVGRVLVCELSTLNIGWCVWVLGECCYVRQVITTFSCLYALGALISIGCKQPQFWLLFMHFECLFLCVILLLPCGFALRMRVSIGPTSCRYWLVCTRVTCRKCTEQVGFSSLH